MFIKTCVTALLAISATAVAFAPVAFTPRSISSQLQVGNEGMGRLEEIVFKIYPGGRVEELVRGIKGGDCLKVTEELNKKLGQVIHTEPTEEMYEQELVIEETLTETLGDGTGGWDGKSSW